MKKRNRLRYLLFFIFAMVNQDEYSALRDDFMSAAKASALAAGPSGDAIGSNVSKWVEDITSTFVTSMQMGSGSPSTTSTSHTTHTESYSVSSFTVNHVGFNSAVVSTDAPVFNSSSIDSGDDTLDGGTGAAANDETTYTWRDAA